MLKLYVASSWRNERYPGVVEALQLAGHQVFDWRSPAHGRPFGWRELDEDWQAWSPRKFRTMLQHPVALEGFQKDYQGMQGADVCVLLAPCGRSAHLEAGWFWGQGKPVLILLAEGEEPELMYRGCVLVLTVSELLAELRRLDPNPLPRALRREMTVEDVVIWLIDHAADGVTITRESARRLSVYTEAEGVEVTMSLPADADRGTAAELLARYPHFFNLDDGEA